MPAYFDYILKVNGCLAAFYIFYFILLRKVTFFRFNRMYLLAGLLFSFIIPLLEVSFAFEIADTTETGGFAATLVQTVSEPVALQNLNAFTYVKSSNSSSILSALYIAGSLLLFFRLVFSLVKTVRLGNHAEILQPVNPRILKANVRSPFSFFNTIFLPENGADPLIVEHEKAHVEQKHWFDLLAVELVILLSWFNPFVFLYKNSMKLQHEYLADNKVTRNPSFLEDYLHCMFRQAQKTAIGGLTSNFYCKTIKKRIIMITKNKTSNKYYSIGIFIIPLIAVLVMSFADKTSDFAKYPESAQTENSVEISENMITKTDIDQIPSIYPVDAAKIKRTSGFGNRAHPITKKASFHPGIDISLSSGEKVFATADGTVVKSEHDTGKGNYVYIRHSDVFSSLYSHLESYAVKAGEQVKKGQVIGYVGNTGMATGPHLHYEIHKNGKPVNPKDYFPKE